MNTLSFLRHIMSPKEDYGKYYSFSSIIKQNDVNNIISNINMTYFNLYKDITKFNL